MIDNLPKCATVDCRGWPMCQCRQPEIKAPRCALESPRIQVPGVDSLRVKLDAHGSVWLVLTDADGAVSLVPVSMRAVAA